MRIYLHYTTYLGICFSQGFKICLWHNVYIRLYQGQKREIFDAYLKYAETVTLTICTIRESCGELKLFF